MKFIENRAYVHKTNKVVPSSNGPLTVEEWEPHFDLLSIHAPIPEEDVDKQFQLLMYDCAMKPYYKNLTECIGNLMAEFPFRISHRFEEDSLSVSNVDFLRSMGMFFGYFVNCTSWETQKMMPYDKRELLKRLDKMRMEIANTPEYTEPVVEEGPGTSPNVQNHE